MADTTPRKDAQTITADGRLVGRHIAGVVVRHQPPVEDERGEICEVYNPAWGLPDAPLVYVYQVMIRPRKAKGWVVHRHQDDRLFLSAGTLRIALYDDRAESPTHRLLNVFTVSERNRALVVIPRGVYHAFQNVDEHDTYFINLPTAPYNHADPDKLRLPLKNDLIPFAFEDSLGW